MQRCDSVAVFCDGQTDRQTDGRTDGQRHGRAWGCWRCRWGTGRAYWRQSLDSGPATSSSVMAMASMAASPKAFSSEALRNGRGLGVLGACAQTDRPDVTDGLEVLGACAQTVQTSLADRTSRRAGTARGVAGG
jgi:hypothetical protein